MRLLYKDQCKKIRHNLFNFISLSLLVIVISLSFTAVKSSIIRLEQNYDEYLEEQQVEDFYFSMGKVDVNYLGGTAILELCRELDLMMECGTAFSFPDDPVVLNNLNFLINDRIDERPELYENIIDGYVDEFVERYDYVVEKKGVLNIVDDEFIYKFMTLTDTIDIPYLVEGELPVENYEIAIFPEFAEINGIEIGDMYDISGTEYKVTGFFYAPEFLFPIFSMSTISFDKSVQTLVLCNDYTINAFDQYVFQKYLIKGDLSLIFSEYNYETIQNVDKSILGKSMQLVHILMPKEINFRIISLPTEVDNATIFVDMFLTLFIGFIMLLLVIFMKRYIDKNKKDIFTLQALGYTNFELTKALMVFPLLISLMTIIGYGFGLIASDSLFELYGSRYLFPKAPFGVYPLIFVFSVVIPIILINIFSFIFIYRALQFKQRKSPLLKWNIFKFTPFKTVIQSFVLFLTISIMIIFGLNGNSMFSAFIEETKLGNNYHQMVNLQYMINDPLDSEYDSYTKVNGSISLVNDLELDSIYHTTIYGINENNNLKLLIDNNSTNNLLLLEGVIISDYLSSKTGITTSDTITFEIGKQSLTYNVMGISNELIESNIFMSKESLNAIYDLDNSYYNGVYITNDLYESEYVTSRIDYQNSLEEFVSLLNVSSIIMSFILALSIILSLFIFGLVIINYLSDNRLNIAILKSIGFNNKEINRKYLLHIYIIVVVTYFLAIPITQLFLDLMLLKLMESIGFKLVLRISFTNIVIGFMLLNSIFITTLYFVSRYYNKVTISEVLHHNIK